MSRPGFHIKTSTFKYHLLRNTKTVSGHLELLMINNDKHYYSSSSWKMSNIWQTLLELYYNNYKRKWTVWHNLRQSRGKSFAGDFCPMPQISRCTTIKFNIMIYQYTSTTLWQVKTSLCLLIWMSSFPALVHVLWFVRDQCRSWFTPDTNEFDLIRELYKTWPRSKPVPQRRSRHWSVNAQVRCYW